MINKEKRKTSPLPRGSRSRSRKRTRRVTRPGLAKGKRTRTRHGGQRKAAPAEESYGVNPATTTGTRRDPDQPTDAVSVLDGSIPRIGQSSSPSSCLLLAS